MTLRHLEIFMTVCETLSMTRAAQEMNLSVPGVSKAISELEAFYQVSLFETDGSTLALTDAGRELKGYAASVLSGEEGSVRTAEDRNALQVCRLGVNASVGETVLSELCRMIRTEIPGISLKVKVSHSAQILRDLKDNVCDIAVIDRKDDSGMNAEPLYDERVLMVCSGSYFSGEKLTGEILKESTLLIREEGAGSRSCIGHPDSFFCWECTSDEMILKLAADGHGIGVLPESYVRMYGGGLRVFSVGDPAFLRHFWLVSPAERYMNRASLQCMDVIRRALGKDGELRA